MPSTVTPPPAHVRSSAAGRWLGRALLLGTAGAGIWLAGAATASADTADDAGPVDGITAVVSESLPVVPQTVDAVVAPMTGSPVVQPVVAAVQPTLDLVTSTVAEVAAPVDTVVLAVGRPVRPVVEPLLEALAPVAGPVVDELPIPPLAHAVPQPTTDLAAGPVPTAAAATQHVDPAVTASASSPTGPLPVAPSKAPLSPSALTPPTTGAGHAPSGPDLGSADLPDNTLRAALAAAGTSSEGPAASIGTAAFDPSFSPD